MKSIRTTLWIAAALIGLVGFVAAPVAADQVFLDDVIIDGSACVGFDCVNGESFGFDTLRLKENNLRIHFQDTSNSASFPSNDWRISINDTTNGGANRFSIEDTDGGRLPFTIEAGAPANALYVDDGGRLGLSTSTPVVELHIVDGDTPTLRLEQDGSSGFTPQTWDVAGNETNFFIRDATNGSTLPFRIQPGAGTSSIFIGNDEQVGINAGTSPDARLDVVTTDGETGIQVTSAGAGPETLLQLIAPDRPRFEFQSTNTNTWLFEVNNSNFDLNLSGSGGDEEMRIEPDGDMIIAGMLTELSRRASKEEFEPVDGAEVLARLKELELSTWKYKKTDDGARHLGPMAEDFYATFGLGSDNEHIAPSDKVGVALAAIQGLTAELDSANSTIEMLTERLTALEAQLEGR